MSDEELRVFLRHPLTQRLNRELLEAFRREAEKKRSVAQKPQEIVYTSD